MIPNKMLHTIFFITGTNGIILYVDSFWYYHCLHSSFFLLHLDSAAVEDGVGGRGWPPDHTQELVSRSTAGGAASATGPHAA